MKYSIKTYGCQMNYSDSERIAAILESAGYKKALSEDKADLIVINACSVRQSAINKISGRFKKYKKLRKTNSNLKIILTGCVLENDKRKFEKMFDLVVGTGGMKQLLNCHPELNCHSELVSESAKITDLIVSTSPELSTTEIGTNCGRKQKILKQVQNDNRQVCANNSNYFKIKPLHQSKLSAYIPIMTGCNNFCSYCVVPYTRGREYSRPVEEIIEEVSSLIEQGYKEIILLGQNVNSYKSEIRNQELEISKHLKLLTPDNLTMEQFNNSGTSSLLSPRRSLSAEDCDEKVRNSLQSSAERLQRDKNKKVLNKTINFPKLLKLLNAIPGDFRIRFLTSHPKDMSENLIKTIAECEKVTPHIHLALQSGDNEILKKMNRKYTAEHFLKLVKMIRNYLPNAAISTDVIIGFPGETEKQFQNTVEVMEKAKFDLAYLNKYSPRPDTAAAKLNDNISWQEKKRREKILTEVLEKTALENNEKYVGRVVEVLVDEVKIKKLGNLDIRILFGKTESFKNVKILDSRFSIPDSDIIGKFLKTKITQAGTWGLEGEVVR